MSKLTYDYRDHPEDWPIEERIRRYAEHLASEIHLDYKGRVHVTPSEPYRGMFNADGSLNWNRIPPKHQGRTPTGLVYFIQQRTEGGLIKIGYTSDVKLRLATLETASSVPLRLLLARPGTKEDERSLHRRFATLRVKGEWFSPSRRLIELIEVEKASTNAPSLKRNVSSPRNAETINIAAREKALREFLAQHPGHTVADPAEIEKEWEESRKESERRVREFRLREARIAALLENSANHVVKYPSLFHRFLGLKPRSCACAEGRHEVCGGRYIDDTISGKCHCECHA